MEDISDEDYLHTKIVCKDFEIQNSGEYHDLHVQSDIVSWCIWKTSKYVS